MWARLLGTCSSVSLFERGRTWPERWHEWPRSLRAVGGTEAQVRVLVP